MTEEMQRKETEREIRLALLAFLANKDTPLGHIRHIVQPHLRENPSAINRGESYVMNVPINELITRFKIACKMLGSQDKRKKTHPPRISSSNTKPTKKITTNNQGRRMDIVYIPYLVLLLLPFTQIYKLLIVQSTIAFTV